MPRKIIVFFAGIVISIFLLEIGIRAGNFLYVSLREYKNKRAIYDRGTYRIMCIGESTTAGGGESYPAQLEGILNDKDIGVKFSVINKGIDGSNSSAIMAQLEGNIVRYEPDMIIAMMGSNDGMLRLPYGNIPVSDKIPLKTYRLIRFLWYNVLNRISDVEHYKEQQKLFEEREKGYLEKVDVFLEEGDCDKAEQFFKEAMEVDLSDVESRIRLGRLYREQSRYDEAEAVLTSAIEINPENSRVYVELGWMYRDAVLMDKSVEIFKKAIVVNEREIEAYWQLGQDYYILGDYKSAEEILARGIEVNSEIPEIYIWLARVYKGQGRYIKAKEMFEKVVELSPCFRDAYELAFLYIEDKEYQKAKEVMVKAIGNNLEDTEWIYNILSCIYEAGEQDEGNRMKSNKRKDKDEAARGGISLITRRNYQLLSKITLERGIKLVCMSYPMRSVLPLKKVMGFPDEVIFVDNERIFKDAVKRDGYNDYFEDMFAGDFGHCMRKGYRLLAENATNVILERVFCK